MKITELGKYKCCSKIVEYVVNEIEIICIDELSKQAVARRNNDGFYSLSIFDTGTGFCIDDEIIDASEELISFEGK